MQKFASICYQNHSLTCRSNTSLPGRAVASKLGPLLPSPLKGPGQMHRHFHYHHQWKDVCPVGYAEAPLLVLPTKELGPGGHGKTPPLLLPPMKEPGAGGYGGGAQLLPTPTKELGPGGYARECRVCKF